MFDAKLTLDSLEHDTNWRCIEIVGASVYSATGIHANVVTTLANAHVSIFAISTFDTDYILLKWDKLDAALQALRSKGYKVIEYDR